MDGRWHSDANLRRGGRLRCPRGVVGIIDERRGGSVLGLGQGCGKRGERGTGGSLKLVGARGEKERERGSSSG
jgi:hypothetical protein